MRKLCTLISLSTLALLSISTSSQAARSFVADMPFQAAGPNFSGFYINGGLAYNMLSLGADYGAVVTYGDQSGQTVAISGSGTKGAGEVGGLFKVGYAFRLQPQWYVGASLFYNAHADQNLTIENVAFTTVSGTGSINVSEQVGSSYGFLLQPGYILGDHKSSIYMNLGMELTPVQVASVVQAGNSPLDSTRLSTTKTANNVKIGVGYQREMNLLKFKGSNNLTWFVEDNYTPTSTMNISQTESDVQPPNRTEGIKAKVGDNQIVLGVNYYFG